MNVVFGDTAREHLASSSLLPAESITLLLQVYHPVLRRFLFTSPVLSDRSFLATQRLVDPYQGLGSVEKITPLRFELRHNPISRRIMWRQIFFDLERLIQGKVDIKLRHIDRFGQENNIVPHAWKWQSIDPDWMRCRELQGRWL